MIDSKDLDKRFAYHPASTEKRRQSHERIRAAARALADVINEEAPNGREKSTAVTRAEEAMMWGNAGVARQD